MVLEKLSEIEVKLPSKTFIRVHKSFIVNINHIKHIEGNMIKVKDKIIPVSLTYKQSVDELLSRRG